MSFIATANPPVIGAEQPVQNHPWFPAVSLHDLRNVCLLDGTVTPNRLRHALHDDHLCTSEVAALCLDKAGDAQAGALLHELIDLLARHGGTANKALAHTVVRLLPFFSMACKGGHEIRTESD